MKLFVFSANLYVLLVALYLSLFAITAKTNENSTSSSERNVDYTELFCIDRQYECHVKYCATINKMCNCDPDCVYYRDCCFDANKSEDCTANYGSSSANNQPPDMLEYMTCERITMSLEVPVPGGWMISRCPATFDAPDIVQLCENPPREEVFLNTPVFVVQNKRLYRNIFCVSCHDDDTQDLVFMTLELLCFDLNSNEDANNVSSSSVNISDSTLDDGTSDDGTSDDVTRDDVTRDDGTSDGSELVSTPQDQEDVIKSANADRCVRKFVLPRELKASYSYRHCWVVEETECTYPGSCPDYMAPYWTWTKLGTTENCPGCDLHPKPFRVVSGEISVAKMYRNRECASCNGANTTVPPCELETYNLKDRVQAVPSLANIFLFRDGYRSSQESGIVEVTSVCSANEIFDPYSRYCRPIFYCPVNSEVKDGKCLQPSFSDTSAGNTSDELQISLQLRSSKKPCDYPRKDGNPDCFDLSQQMTEIVNAHFEKMFGLNQTELKMVAIACYPADNHNGHRCNANTVDVNSTSCHIELSVPDKTNLSGLIAHAERTSFFQYLGDCVDIPESEGAEINFESWSMHITKVACMEIENVTWSFATGADSQSTAVARNYDECLKDAKLAERIKCQYSMYGVTEYQFRESQLTLVEQNKTYSSDQFVIYSNGSAIVCKEIVEIITSGFLGKYGGILTAVGCSFSLVALFATMVTYTVLAKLRNSVGKSILGLVLSLFVAQLFLIAFGDKTENVNFCTFVAVVSHFSWLAAFFWMGVLAFDLSCTFGCRAKIQTVRDSKKTFLKYCLFGVGGPLSIVSLCLAIHLMDIPEIKFRYVNEYLCWFRSVQDNLLALGLPIAALLVLNVILFMDTVVGIRMANNARKKITAETKKSGNGGKQELMLYTKLTAVMGFSWIFGYVANIISGTEIVWYIYIILNSFQGIYIFLAFGCTSRVYQMWLLKFGIQKKRRSGETCTSKKISSSSQSTKSSSVYTIHSQYNPKASDDISDAKV